MYTFKYSCYRCIIYSLMFERKESFMIDFDEMNKNIAEVYVNKYFAKMKEKLEQDGYFMYDEYEIIYIHAGRFIPEILNDRLLFEEDGDSLIAVEEMIKGEGNCGIVIKKGMYDKNLIYQLLEKFYKR